MLGYTRWKAALQKRSHSWSWWTPCWTSDTCPRGKKPNSILGYINTGVASRLRDANSPLFITGQTIPGVLCPVLGSSVQQRHQHTGEHLMTSHKAIEGLKALLKILNIYHMTKAWNLELFSLEKPVICLQVWSFKITNKNTVLSSFVLGWQTTKYTVCLILPTQKILFLRFEMPYISFIKYRKEIKHSVYLKLIF